MTRDLGDEFLEQGEKLLEKNKIKEAIERLTWAKNLHIRHEKYQNPTLTKTSMTSSVSKLDSDNNNQSSFNFM